MESEALQKPKLRSKIFQLTLSPRNITVHLSNISKSDSGAPVEVAQISLVSHSNRLAQLESSSGAALAVRRADSLAVSLKAQRATTGGGVEDKEEMEEDCDRIHFSSVSCSSGEGEGEGPDDVQQPPHLGRNSIEKSNSIFYQKLILQLSFFSAV